MEIEMLVKKQRAYFEKGKTKEVPWNYPFMLSMEPLIGAIAAGNCVIVKPSAYAPATADVIEKIIEDCFSSHFVAVVKGGRAENAALLEQRFDFIFFTGSVRVGRLVMEKASRYLTQICVWLQNELCLENI